MKSILPTARVAAPIGAPPAPFSQAPPSRITHHASRVPRPPSPVPRHAFTLVEILVTITLLAFIIVGLFAVFGQVQRAFRSGLAQVDRLEAGRAVTEMLARELEQTIPSGSPAANGANFYAQILDSAPLTQSLPGSPIMRTNLLQDCFLLLRQNQTWVGIGYCVRVSGANGRLYWPETGSGSGRMGVGSLYRFETNLPVLYNAPNFNFHGTRQDPFQMFQDFTNACVSGSVKSATCFSRVCDGVIHFRFRAFDTNGTLLVPKVPRWPAIDIVYSPVAPGEIALYRFYSNAVPASVEMELGILEQPSFDRYNSIGAPNARLTYLQREEISSRVHLFRQRIPIRNVDPLAYQ